jgi:hypothetical protein
MPNLVEDPGHAFHVSNAEWHDRAYHNASRKQHLQRKVEVLQRDGVDIRTIETNIHSYKTMRLERMEAHIRDAVAAYTILCRHYQSERVTRWKTYRHEQRALHTLCMRVKGNPRLPRDRVVVGYGAGQFGSSMQGKRSAPVQKFRNFLSRYCTVVLVDEFRTSRVCSHRLMGHPLHDPGGGGEGGGAGGEVVGDGGEEEVVGEQPE